MTESSSSAPNKRKRSTYDRALDMLEARARGVAELRRRLMQKGEPEVDVCAPDALGAAALAGS